MAGLLTGITDAIGLTDSKATEKAYGKADAATQDVLERLDAIDLPDEEKLKVLLESPELVGLLEAEALEDSRLEQIDLDPNLRQNQLDALQMLKERSDQGLTLQDRFEMDQMLGDVAAQEKASQRQIESQMAQRGMDSSGASLMAKLQNKQSSANQARERAMQMAAQAQQNKMAALSQLGQQSGQMQQQDFNRQASVASAQDAIARANAMNRQNVNAANLQARQQIANQRSNIGNQQQMYNAGIEQQQFQNRMSKAGAQNQASQNMAQQFMNRGAANASADSQMLSGVIGAGAALAKGGAQDGGIARYADGGCASDTPRAEDGAFILDEGVIDVGQGQYAGDRIDAKVNEGEMIVNIPQQERLMDLIRGEINVDELGNDDIIEGVPRDFRNELHERSEEKPSKKQKYDLLTRLLDFVEGE